MASTPNQTDQFEELLNPKRGPSRGNSDKWILAYGARPVGGQRAQPVGAIVKPNPMLAPVLRAKLQFKFPAEQRVIRMGYRETSASIVASGRNLLLAPMRLRRASSTA
jgi:hypothetical protein